MNVQPRGRRKQKRKQKWKMKRILFIERAEKGASVPLWLSCDLWRERRRREVAQRPTSPSGSCSAPLPPQGAGWGSEGDGKGRCQASDGGEREREGGRQMGRTERARTRAQCCIAEVERGRFDSFFFLQFFLFFSFLGFSFSPRFFLLRVSVYVFSFFVDFFVIYDLLFFATLPPSFYPWEIDECQWASWDGHECLGATSSSSLSMSFRLASLPSSLSSSSSSSPLLPLRAVVCSVARGVVRTSSATSAPLFYSPPWRYFSSFFIKTNSEERKKKM